RPRQRRPGPADARGPRAPERLAHPPPPRPLAAQSPGHRSLDGGGGAPRRSHTHPLPGALAQLQPRSSAMSRMMGIGTPSSHNSMPFPSPPFLPLISMSAPSRHHGDLDVLLG